MSFTNNNPILIFNNWFAEEMQANTSEVPSACCLSTIGTDGFPNARFVALKEVKEDAFILTGPLQSRKGIEIKKIPQAALTFWWVKTQRQVRIQGHVMRIPETDADHYFETRSPESQLVSILSRQGESMTSQPLLSELIEKDERQFDTDQLKRPNDWGGFSISPVRIELMTFKANRFHERKLYTKTEFGWDMVLLQP